MTRASKQRLLDVKVGDIISTTADKVHGKQSKARTMKRAWHAFKQNHNSSHITIQQHSHGILREVDELKHAKDFRALLNQNTPLGKLKGEDKLEAITKFEQQLDQLIEAVNTSSVGFVGASILLSCDDGVPNITLIDVENCVMPTDQGVTQKSVEQKKHHFVLGLQTLKNELQKERSFVI